MRQRKIAFWACALIALLHIFSSLLFEKNMISYQPLFGASFLFFLCIAALLSYNLKTTMTMAAVVGLVITVCFYVSQEWYVYSLEKGIALAIGTYIASSIMVNAVQGFFGQETIFSKTE